MGTALTGLEIRDTYDALVKITDNGPLSGTAKYLSDGLGNDSALALSTGNIGMGTTSLNSRLTVQGGDGITIRNAGDTFLQCIDTSDAGVNYLEFKGSGGATGSISYSQATDFMAFRANSAERMRITSAGNVGIGTSAPASNKILHLNNGSGSFVRMSMTNTATGASDTDGLSFQVENSKAIIKNQENEDLVLGANNSETQLVLAAGGNVGIGTTAPADLLSLDGGANFPFIRISSTGNTGSRHFRIGMTDATTHTIEAVGPNTEINFLTSGSERMRINQSGNVGIGTSAPADKLHVAFDSDFSLRIDGAGDIKQYRGDGSTGGLNLETALTSGSWGTNGGFVAISPRGTERMRITSAGNVGIGTSSPAKEFEVYKATDGATIRISSGQNDSNHVTTTPFGILEFYSGDASTPGAGVRSSIGSYPVDASGSSGSNLIFNNSNASGSFEAMRITNGGTIGIGTSSPAASLHVFGNSGDMLRLDRNNTGAVGNQIAFRHSNAGTLTETATINVVSTANADTGSLVFSTKPTGGSVSERMRINAAGKVGINTTSALGQLNIRNESAGATTNALALYNNPSNTENTGVAIEFYPNVGVDDRCARISAVNPTTTGTNLSDLRFFTSNNAAPTEKLRITHTGNVLLGSQQLLGINTADGSDDGYLSLAGAGGDGDARGGHIYLSGNERTVDAGSIVLAGGTTSTGTGATAAIVFRTSGTERMRVLAAGGLTFNGDTAAANALDDYEEGTWTMGVSFDGASAGVTYSNNTGKYTKIGRQVTASGYLNLTSKGSSTGNARITGLPFTVPSGYESLASAALWFENLTFANQFMGYAENDATTVRLQELTEGGTLTNLTEADFANNTGIMVSLTYFV